MGRSWRCSRTGRQQRQVIRKTRINESCCPGRVVDEKYLWGKKFLKNTSSDSWFVKCERFLPFHFCQVSIPILAAVPVPWQQKHWEEQPNLYCVDTSGKAEIFIIYLQNTWICYYFLGVPETHLHLSGSLKSYASPQACYKVKPQGVQIGEHVKGNLFDEWTSLPDTFHLKKPSFIVLPVFLSGQTCLTFWYLHEKISLSFRGDSGGSYWELRGFSLASSIGQWPVNILISLFKKSRKYLIK